MTVNEIKVALSNISKKEIDFDKVLKELKSYKINAVTNKQENEAKEIWILEQIVKIHQTYLEAFSLLKAKSYYEAWCKLEKIEIKFLGLKRHFEFDKEEYKLYFIEKSVLNLQAIYPYSVFFSSEILELEKKCNICNNVVVLRKPCGHKVGEIYNGEYCIRIISKSKLLGIAVVENPVNKYSVAFTVDSKTDQKVDQYNYASINYLFELVNSPYEYWDLEIKYKLISHNYFKNYGRNDLCPCMSGQKYKKCCLANKGVKNLHHDFIVKNPSDKKILTTTLRK